MKKILIFTALLIPFFSLASLHFSFDLQTNDKHVIEEFELTEKDQVGLLETSEFLLEFSATPEEDLASIAFQIYRKTKQGPKLTCSPEIKVLWGKESTISYSKDGTDSERFALTVTVTQD